MNTPKEKKFDAVKMMREIRSKIYEETKEMSFTEFKSYLNNRKFRLVK